MGVVPANIADGASPYPKDQANGVVEGVLDAAWEASEPFTFYGSYNLTLVPFISQALTTTAGSLAASVASITGMSVGDPISASTLPEGAYVAVVGGTTTITLGGISAAEVEAGTVTATSWGDTAADAIVRLERSFDGGNLWTARSRALDGTKAEWDMDTAGLQAGVSCVFTEPENGVATRVRCVEYTAGKIAYRLSATGNMAQSAGVNSGGP